MSKQFRVAIEPAILKPVIESMIFASEEPLAARALIRLLSGERDNGKQEIEVPPLAALMEGRDVPELADGEASEGTASDQDNLGADSDVDDSNNEDRSDAEAPAEPSTEVLQDGAAVDVEELAAAMNDIEGREAGQSAEPAIDQSMVRALIAELNEEYETTGRAFRIVEVAGGFQFATIREYGEYVALLSKEKLRRRLSPAALETLAIIAYRQPVSKPEVEAIRGVNCDQVLLNLMEKNLVAITGRSEGVGRPLLYGTTEDFLRSFGLKGIGDLPKLREIEELMEEGAYSPEKADVITVDANTAVEEIEARVGAAGHAEHGGEGDAPDAGPEPDGAVEAVEHAGTSGEDDAGAGGGTEQAGEDDDEGNREEENEVEDEGEGGEDEDEGEGEEADGDEDGDDEDGDDEEEADGDEEDDDGDEDDEEDDDGDEDDVEDGVDEDEDSDDEDEDGDDEDSDEEDEGDAGDEDGDDDDEEGEEGDDKSDEGDDEDAPRGEGNGDGGLEDEEPSRADAGSIELVVGDDEAA